MSNTPIAGLVDSNLHTLNSALELLEQLSADLYCQIQRPYFESSFGKHLRHILDHYICFKRDLGKGKIDYDQRHRDCQLETDKDYAVNVIKDIRDFMASMKETHTSDTPLQVLMCNDVDIPGGLTTESSVGRELQFLQGHSVHHYALMATMMRFAKVSVSEDFGVAPSTIVHNNTVKESA